MSEKTPEELSVIFHSKFPEDVIQDEKTMESLTTLGKRLESMQDKYQHVRREATKYIFDI